jgi:hypothetical protein
MTTQVATGNSSDGALSLLEYTRLLLSVNMTTVTIQPAAGCRLPAAGYVDAVEKLPCDHETATLLESWSCRQGYIAGVTTAETLTSAYL